jgi:tetratricopeptide (TPR) repeat protein
MGLGDTLHDARRYEEAVTVLTEAVARFAELGDWHSEGVQLTSLGNTLFAMDRSPEAVAAYSRALTLYEQRGDEHHQAIAMQHLWSASELSPEEAVGNYQKLVAIYHKVCERTAEGMALSALGNQLRQLGRYDEALEAHRRAADIYEAREDEALLGPALRDLGTTLREAGHLVEAAETHAREILLFRTLGDRHKEAEALMSLAGTLRLRRCRTQAVEASAKAAVLFRQLQDEWCEKRALSELGPRIPDARRTDEVMTLYTQVMAHTREGSFFSDECRVLLALGIAQLWKRRTTAAFWSYVSLLVTFGRLMEESGECTSLGDCLRLRRDMRKVFPRGRPLRALAARWTKRRQPTA